MRHRVAVSLVVLIVIATSISIVIQQASPALANTNKGLNCGTNAEYAGYTFKHCTAIELSTDGTTVRARLHLYCYNPAGSLTSCNFVVDDTFYERKPCAPSTTCDWTDLGHANWPNVTGVTDYVWTGAWHPKSTSGATDEVVVFYEVAKWNAIGKTTSVHRSCSLQWQASTNTTGGTSPFC